MDFVYAGAKGSKKGMFRIHRYPDYIAIFDSGEGNCHHYRITKVTCHASDREYLKMIYGYLQARHKNTKITFNQAIV